ncbi:hypothetical protein C8J42_103581 [Sphingomonas sp. PP-CE-1A-559]|uniref:hypothetical protein n=1 Tax=Sphingomonas sp. PP-CE-1A-559 TaxID=2135657 RepID=UPI001056C8E4|nr:hypothetical protein [Sphingomonas sp. PP-CE-1A-559]TCP91889.1 hypothetical protein C8J42_103581 [Sphingomonas sp. PP-CE-1A-559]
MTDTDPKTKRAFVISDFTDIGTDTRHVAGTTPMIETGAFGNYEAAGLVRAPTAADAKAPAKPKTRPAKKAKAVAAPAPAAPPASSQADAPPPVA